MRDIEFLQAAERSRRYGSELFWSRSVGEKIGVRNLPFLDALSNAYQARLQKLRPDIRKKYYYWHHQKFLAGFLDHPSIVVRDTPELMLAGYESEFDRVEPIVRNRRNEIKAASGKEPKKIAVFIGSGAVMDQSYRAIGLGNQPFYTYALAGALDAYLATNFWHNTMHLSPRDPDRAMIKRVIGHEPSHPLWNSVFVDEEGSPTWQLDKNRMVYEALGGPLKPEAWEDVDISEIKSVDFTPLENAVAQIVKGQPVENNFSSWLSITSQRNRVFGRHPLSDPTWALFYQWAAQKGDERYWHELAKNLR